MNTAEVPDTANGTRSRQVVALVAALSLSAAAGCGKKEAMVLPTPEVYVTTAVQKDVPGDDGARRPDGGLEGRRDPRAGRGVPRERQLPRGRLRQAGGPPLHHRPEAARGDGGPGEGERRHGAGQARPGAAGRRPAEAPRRAAGGQPARLRQLGLEPGRGEGPARRGEGRARLRPAQPRLHEDLGAPLGPRGPEQGEAGEPRRPWRVDAPHHDLRHRPDLLHGEPERGGLPAPRRPAPEEARRRRGSGGRSTSSWRTARCTRKRATSTRSSGRSTRRPGRSRPGSSSRTRRASSARGSTAGSSSSSTP